MTMKFKSKPFQFLLQPVYFVINIFFAVKAPLYSKRAVFSKFVIKEDKERIFRVYGQPLKDKIPRFSVDSKKLFTPSIDRVLTQKILKSKPFNIFIIANTFFLFKIHNYLKLAVIKFLYYHHH